MLTLASSHCFDATLDLVYSLLNHYVFFFLLLFFIWCFTKDDISTPFRIPSSYLVGNQVGERMEAIGQVLHYIALHLI